MHVAGIVLAATAGFFWALYILLGVRVGQKFAGRERARAGDGARRAC